MSIAGKISELRSQLPEDVELVAVSKTYPTEDITEAYNAGQRVFGESRPQEMTAKYNALPKDIEWYMIGHLQTNKVKYIAPFVSLIHSADSEKLLDAINKEALKNNRVIDVLLEIHIAEESGKSGWEERELFGYLERDTYRQLAGVRFRGVMGIATYTEDQKQIEEEFSRLGEIHRKLKGEFFGADFDIVSMGMTGDYRLAVECGSNMVRIGSYIFGERDYTNKN